jgi:hypothetical protein
MWGTRTKKAMDLVESQVAVDQMERSEAAKKSARQYAESIAESIKLLADFSDKIVQSPNDLNDIKKAMILNKKQVVKVTLNNGFSFLYDLDSGLVASYTGKNYPEVEQ